MRHFHVGIGLLTLLISAPITMPDAVAFGTSPESLTFTAVEGGSNPPIQAVIISKDNKRNVNWATSYSPVWLRITLSPKLVPSDQLLVSVDVGGLAAGIYRGTVTMAATKGESISIPVTLTIAERARASTATTAMLTSVPHTKANLPGN